MDIERNTLTIDEFIEAHPKLKAMVRYDAQQRVARWIARGRITKNADNTINREHLANELAALPQEAPVAGEKELAAVIANLQAQLTAKDDEIASLREELASLKEEHHGKPKKK